VISSPGAAPGGDRALVHLDARHRAQALEEPGERLARRALLTQGLLVEDHARDELAHARRGEEQVAVGAAVLLGVLHLDGGEALGDRARALVGGEDPAAGLEDLLDRPLEVLREAHGRLRAVGGGAG
jgi:hypothetical protein